MTKKLLFVMTILLVVAFVASAADVTGKWTYEMAGRLLLGLEPLRWLF